MSVSDVYSFPELATNPSQPEVTYNQALAEIGAKLGRVISATTDAQPGSPAEGDTYIITGSASGAQWTGFTAGDIAHYYNSAWTNYTPVEGWRVWVNDTNKVIKYDGTNWIGAIVEDSSNNVTIGQASLATTATDGFPYIPSCAGTPTGTPTTKTGFAPLVIDSTNSKLYAYIGGSWQVMN